MERVLQFTAAKPFFIMESATKTQAKNKYQVSIDLLNDAVGKEIATSLQYMYFHTHFEDDRYQYLSKIMREISIAEMRHIEEFSDRILFLQGDVDMNASFRTRHDDHRLEVLHMLIAYADHQVEVLEVGRREEHRVAARRKILEDEVAVLVGHGRQTQRFDLHLYIAQDHATVARNHLTADASVLRIGREGHGGEHQNK